MKSKDIMKIKKVAGAVLCVLIVAGCAVWMWYGERWKDILTPAVAVAAYDVVHPPDDTLRVLMIGDSWAGMHHSGRCDTMLQAMLAQRVTRPVKMVANGRGGGKSKEIYHLMFRETTPATDSWACTEELLKLGADYCIVSAGINDAAGNLGPDVFCQNYLLIVRTLLAWHMRPVVIEMPDVDINGLYHDKPIRHRMVDRLRAWRTGADMYDVTKYRQELRRRLQADGLMDSVVYVPCASWNELGFRDERNLYIGDHVHLNHEGYRKLDSCLAVYISKDLED